MSVESRGVRVAILMLVVLGPGMALGRVSVSSRFKGYCRVGKYTPVEIVRDAPGEVVIEGDGILPVHVGAGAGGSVVVPLLVVARPGERVRVRAGGSVNEVSVGWRVLSEEEKLVGVVGNVSVKDVWFLFPGKKIVMVALDGTRPLGGTVGGWEVLDAIVCDRGEIPGVDHAATRAVLAGGIVMVVRARAAPDDRWPWERHGEWWVLRNEPFGPGTMLMEGADVPVRGWVAATSPATRVRVVLTGALIGIGLLGVSLVRKRWVMVGCAVVLVAVSVVVIVLWGRRQRVQREVEGVVASFGGGLIQHDFWAYRAGAGTERKAVVSCECFLDVRQPGKNWSRTLARPMVRSAEEAAEKKLRLEVDGAGKPLRWTGEVGRGEVLALMTRVVDPGEYKPSPIYRETSSPMYGLVRQAYLGLGVEVKGQGYPREDGGFAEIYLWRK